MKIESYMVYFRCPDGGREGVEIIKANSRDEAIQIYKRYFNVSDICVAVPRIEPRSEK